MFSEARRKTILEKLKESQRPISATAFGKELSVTRQIIVNDIALLRAQGEKIIATPRGYCIDKQDVSEYVVACKHTEKDLADELYTIIDCGCGVLDVIVEHEIYGQISAKLCVYSKNDADEFLAKFKNGESKPLCSVTNNYHLHTLHCPTKEHFEKVKTKLREKGFCQ